MAILLTSHNLFYVVGWFVDLNFWETPKSVSRYSSVFPNITVQKSLYEILYFFIRVKNVFTEVKTKINKTNNKKIVKKYLVKDDIYLNPILKIN